MSKTRSPLLILAISAALTCLATDPAHAYVVTDAIKAGENIKFNFTYNGEDRDGGFGGTATVDGVPDPIGLNLVPGVPFDWGNLRPDLTGKAARFSFTAPASATDWKQTIISPTGSSTVQAGNITKRSPWSFVPLDQLPGIATRIPDIAPVAGNSGATIYTAVNLDLYMRSNPNGFLAGAWSVGNTLSQLGVEIVDGRIAGVQGLYFATTPFAFDATETGPGFTPTGGAGSLLDSATFASDLVILAQHTSPVSEADTVLLAGSGLIGMVGWRRRRSLCRQGKPRGEK